MRVALAAQQLDAFRTRWLNPPEWAREASISFAASIDGPWAPLVQGANSDGIGTATYRWFAPINDDAEAELEARTLTALYNLPPAWLDETHRALDETVFSAYG